MKQISHRQQSISALYYFFLSGYILVEPFFVKLFFATYLPNFYYPVLTISISIVLLLVGFKKFQKTSGDLTLKQVIVAVAQGYANLLDPKLRKRVLSHCQICCRVLLDLLTTPYSQEPMVRVHSKKALKYYGSIGIYISLLLIGIYHLFWINLPRWGLFETSFTTFFYFFCICLTSIALTSLPKAIDAAKQLRNARRSQSDLNALVKLLRKELKGWHFERRVVLPSADSQAKGDIDVVAISPDDNYFVIELKSHIGKVTWNSEPKMLYQQREKDPEPLPFKEDFLNNVNKQAKLLYKSRGLSQFPDRVLIFWRAKVNISPKKRLKRGVKISEKSRIVNDLEKRNRKLVEKKIVC